MKKTVNAILGVLALGFLASCNTDPGPQYYNEVSAIVHYENEQPFIKTMFGMFAAPDLATKMLYPGTCLWTYFVVDPNNQPTAGTTTASNLQYEEVRHTDARQVDTLVDNFTESISRAVLYALPVENTLFFGFEHQAPEGQLYDYEIIFNEKEVVEEGSIKIPILHIRAVKRNSVGETTLKTVGERYAFNMKAFVDYMRAQSPTISEFNLYLKYKTGVDVENNDVYQSFQHYPVRWGL